VRGADWYDELEDRRAVLSTEPALAHDFRNRVLTLELFPGGRQSRRNTVNEHLSLQLAIEKESPSDELIVVAKGDDHSLRSVSNGSANAARRAGMSAAREPAHESTRLAAMMTTEFAPTDPYRK
jgi:hypothetical protein